MSLRSPYDGINESTTDELEGPPPSTPVTGERSSVSSPPPAATGTDGTSP